MPVDPSRPSYQVDLSEDTLLRLHASVIVRQSVRTATHELNNTLQMVSGSAEMLALMPDLPARARARVETILRHIGRGQAVLEGIAAMARGAGASAQPVDVHKVVEHVLELRRYEHTRAGIEVTSTRGDAAAVMVQGVAAQLEQMLLALLLDAEEAVSGQPGATIALNISRTPEAIVVTLTHNGLRLDGPDDPFAPFTSADETRGLGLFAARLLAARNGGTLSLESPGERGTAAVLRFAPAAR